MVNTFLLMYQSHCERVLDTFKLASVDELRRVVTNFWSEMPAHLAPLLAHSSLGLILHHVDLLLYRVGLSEIYIYIFKKLLFET